MAEALVAFFPGLALGSFLNVVAARVPLRRSIVRPASACMSCATPLAARDNVPVVSYLWLRGRCRACGAQIPLRYPAVELATALLFVGCVLRFGLSRQAGQREHNQRISQFETHGHQPHSCEFAQGPWRFACPP